MVRVDPLSFFENIKTSWRGHELFAMWLVQRLRPKVVVDLGFDQGLSTIAFSYRNRGQVYGIDWFGTMNYEEKTIALDCAFRNIIRAIRLKYAKNIHLIIGPFSQVSRNWNKQIDILHIDWAHSYSETRQHYLNWSPFLKPEAVILVHDVLSYPEEVGRAFSEIPYPKIIFPHSNGLGVACSNGALIEEIVHKYALHDKP